MFMIQWIAGGCPVASSSTLDQALPDKLMKFMGEVV